MMNDGIETNAVVMTIIMRSKMVLRLRAAMEPKRMPKTVAMSSAMMPILAEVRMPSAMTSVTWRPRCLMDGPKSPCRASVR